MREPSLQHFLSKLPHGQVDQDADLRNTFKTANHLLDDCDPPAAVLRPSSVRDLQQLVTAANETGFPLVPVSSGPQHQKGGIACRTIHGAVDLHHWKYIGDIDRRNRVCRIGPGVTYCELMEKLKPHGLTLPVPLSPRAGKSVLAAVMDREPHIWPNKQWDISDPVGSTEFIFGSGERFRTGAAGAPGSLKRQRQAGGAQKCPLGPSQTDFHRVVQGSQGTMGIVTWITLRCEAAPQMEKPFLVGSDRLEPLLVFVYEVQRPWLGEHMFVLDRHGLGMLLAGKEEEAYQRLVTPLPRFVCLQNIAGFDVLPRQRIDYQTKDIRKIAKKHGLRLRRKIGDLTATQLLQAARTPDCQGPGWRRQRKGSALSIVFQSLLNQAPKMISLAEQRAAGSRLASDMAVYLQPQVQNHQCHMEIIFPFDPDAPDSLVEAARLDNALTRDLLEAGAFFSRPYGKPQQVVFSQNPVNLSLLLQVKSIFDPRGILCPGKWGLPLALTRRP